MPHYASTSLSTAQRRRRNLLVVDHSLLPEISTHWSHFCLWSSIAWISIIYLQHNSHLGVWQTLLLGVISMQSNQFPVSWALLQMTWFQGSITTLGNFPLYTPKFLKGPLKTFFLEPNTCCRYALISTLYLRNLTLTLPLCFCVKQHLLTLAFLLVTSQACYFLHKETIKIPFQKSKKYRLGSYLLAVCQLFTCCMSWDT